MITNGRKNSVRMDQAGKGVDPIPLEPNGLKERPSPMPSYSTEDVCESEGVTKRIEVPDTFVLQLPDLARTAPSRLSNLIEALEGSSGEWMLDELSSVLRHQLSTPVIFELCADPIDLPGSPPQLDSSRQSETKSFRDLFTESSPSKHLLQLTKDFAKKHWEHPESALPKDVALVLYYSSIAVAMVRLGERISRLGEAELKTGFSWVRDQKWVDEALRSCCKDAISVLQSPTH